MRLVITSLDMFCLIISLFADPVQRLADSCACVFNGFMRFAMAVRLFCRCQAIMSIRFLRWTCSILQASGLRAVRLASPGFIMLTLSLLF